MYPPQTSLIPAAAALTRYIAEHGFGGNYPYWYLGSTPIKYLTGPILPTILIVLKNAFGLASFFEASYLLLLVTYSLSLMGWFVLIKALTNNSKIALISGIVLAVFPWKYFFSLTLADLPFSVSRGILPFALFAFFKTKANTKVWFWASAILGALLLLIDPTIISDLLVGFMAICFYKAFRTKSLKFKKIGVYVSRAFKIVLLATLFSTIWYTPGLWLTILANPSTGGLSGVGAILRVFSLSKTAVPVLIAIVVVYASHKFKSRFAVFLATWLFSFGFLTLFRFIADWDFWQDWSAWVWELEFGAALFVAYLFYTKRYFVIQISTLLSFVIVTLIFYNHFGKGRFISDELPPYINSVGKLGELAGPSDLVFISGSSVWWANALYDVKQVRGGADRVAVNSLWPKAAWIVRESDDGEETQKYLEELDVKYVLVHTESSKEFFHDFKYLLKWNSLGSVVWSREGDTIYKIY